MRGLMIVLVIVLMLLQFRLWSGEGSIPHKWQLDRQLQAQRYTNDSARRRNEQIAKEVLSLQTNRDSIEEKAREDLGMIRKGEIFYFITDTVDTISSQ